MQLDPQHGSAVGQIKPMAALQYAEGRSWERVPGITARFWLLRHREQRLRQLQIPMDREDPAFLDAMLDVIERLSELESRSASAILEDLLSSDADVLRVRVVSRDAEDGQLTLTADVELRQSTRRALLSAACSVVHPAPFHPRLSRTEPDALLAACRAGQTEIGSYVVKVICPLHALDETLDLQEPKPFTRKVTEHLMVATSGLVGSIERSSVDEFLDAQLERPLVSANLCEALLQMQPDRDAGQVVLSTTWASDPHVRPPAVEVVPDRVVIKAEYLPEIERAARILRPPTTAERDEEFVGTVETLDGMVGDDGRRAGEVVFSLLSPDGETIRARANLNAEQYEEASRAHQGGRTYVAVRGVLLRGARVSRIDPVRQLRMLSGVGLR